MKTKKAKSFSQKELLDLANEAYDDGFLANYYTKKGTLKRGSGDGLAKFIVIELIETFDPRAEKWAQLTEAARALRSAEDQLWNLNHHLSDLVDDPKVCGRDDAL